MPAPMQTLAELNRLCEINAEYQAIDWLRFANKVISEKGHACMIKQNDARVELHVQNNEALLLLFIEGEPAPPMDNIKPQWDTTSMVQDILANIDSFPQAIAWTADLHANDWSSIWLATQWWPMPGITDAVDDPQQWLRWWWNNIMEFTTEPPGLYDTPTP